MSGELSAVSDEPLSLLEKTVCVLTGPVVGLLPPDVQRRLGGWTRNPEAAASLTSLSSRASMLALGTYGLVSLTAHHYGVDIDPSPGNIVTWTAPIVWLDAAVREVGNGLRYALEGGSAVTDYNIPWGEPVLSVLYNRLRRKE